MTLFIRSSENTTWDILSVRCFHSEKWKVWCGWEGVSRSAHLSIVSQSLASGLAPLILSSFISWSHNSNRALSLMSFYAWIWTERRVLPLLLLLPSWRKPILTSPYWIPLSLFWTQRSLMLLSPPWLGEQADCTWLVLVIMFHLLRPE